MLEKGDLIEYKFWNKIGMSKGFEHVGIGVIDKVYNDMIIITKDSDHKIKEHMAIFKDEIKYGYVVVNKLC